MTGFNTMGNDSRNQLAQLMQPPPPVQVPRNHSPYIASPAQQANGGQGGALATPLIGGGLSMLGKGAAAKPQQLWPGLNAADSKRFFDLTNSPTGGGINWNPSGMSSGDFFGSGGMGMWDPSMMGGGGAGGLDMFGSGGMGMWDMGAGSGGLDMFGSGGMGMWGGVGGDAALGAGALGGEAVLGGGAAEGIGAAIAANPELLLLLA